MMSWFLLIKKRKILWLNLQLMQDCFKWALACINGDISSNKNESFVLHSQFTLHTRFVLYTYSSYSTYTVYMLLLPTHSVLSSIDCSILTLLVFYNHSVCSTFVAYTPIYGLCPTYTVYTLYTLYICYINGLYSIGTVPTLHTRFVLYIHILYFTRTVYALHMYMLSLDGS